MITILALLALAAVPCAQEESRLDLRISPIVDLWYEVRARAEEPAEAIAASERMGNAIEAAHALGRTLGSPLAWGFVEGRIAGCERGEDLLESLALLPAEITRRTPSGKGRKIRLREPALALGRAVAALEKDWLRESWPERRARIEAARKDLRESLGEGREAALLERIEALLGLRSPEEPIPVMLVGRAPWPGAVTHRTPKGAACFVAVEDRRGPALAEVVLHESLHAMDAVTEHPAPTLLDAQREAFRAAKVPPGDRRAGNALHTFLFLAAGEAVRTVLDPDYEDYGVTSGVYERLGKAAAFVRPAWTLYVAGELDADGLVARIATELARAGGGGEPDGDG